MFLTSLALLALLALIVTAAALPLFGYESSVIYGGSMEPAIGRGALVVSRPVDVETLSVGDIISFRRSETTVKVTHRVVALREENSQRFFTMKGDANASPDPGEMTFDGPVEKVTLVLPYIGYFIAFGRSPQGMLLLVVLPAISLALLQLLSIGKGKEKREKTPI